MAKKGKGRANTLSSGVQTGTYGGPVAVAQKTAKQSKAEKAAAKKAAAAAKKAEAKKNNDVANFKPGDSNAAIEGQFDTAKKTTITGNQLNNAQQKNAYGSQTITYDENGNPTVTQSLDPAEQQKLDQERGIETGANQQAQTQLGQLQQQWANPLSYDSQPQVNMDQEGFRQSWEDKMYGRQAQRLDKQYAQAADSFEQQMADRGIPVGSELYNNQKAQFEQNKADTYEGARVAAMQQSGQEAQRQFGNTLTARQQGISETNSLRDRPLNEIGGLMALGSGVAQPQFQGFQGQQMANTDVAGTALGYANLGQNAADNSAARDVQLQAIAKRGGGGGGGSVDDKIRLMQYDFDNNPQYRKEQPKRPGVGERIGGSILGGVVNGITTGIGNRISGAFGGSK